MQFVRKLPPFVGVGDAIIPGRVSDETGFVDTGVSFDGLRGPIPVYLSAEGIRQIARRYPQLGLVPESELAEIMEDSEAEHQELNLLRSRVGDLEAQLERIAGLSRDGFTVTKKTGRPPKKES